MAARKRNKLDMIPHNAENSFPQGGAPAGEGEVVDDGTGRRR
jgi:hypothetical protein